MKSAFGIATCLIVGTACLIGTIHYKAKLDEEAAAHQYEQESRLQAQKAAHRARELLMESYARPAESSVTRSSSCHGYVVGNSFSTQCY